MRNKKSFSFDEEKDVEDIIVNGFPNRSIDYSKMYLIAKYFRQKFNYGEVRLERELLRFCKTHDPNFNPIIEAGAIRKWITSAMNYGLRKITSISISPREIVFLKSIENEKDRKLLFITLVMSKTLKNSTIRKDKSKIKTSPNYYIRYNNFSDIIRLSKINNLSETDLADVYNKYKEHFIFYNAEREVIQVCYIDKNPENSISIDNLDMILDYYELFFGKNTGICTLCNKTFSKKSNRQRVCPECSIQLERERKNRWKRKNKQ